MLSFEIKDASLVAALNEILKEIPNAADLVDRCGLMHDAAFHGSVQRRPDLADLGRRRPPLVNGLRHFLVAHAHLVRTEGFQRVDTAAVAQGQLCDFALLTQVSVFAALDDRHVEHLRSGGTVDVAAVLKNLQAPLLPRKVC